MNQLALRSKFNEVFKKEKLYFFAPGRVNLIGEHTDYNGGTFFRARSRSVRIVYSANATIKKYVFIR